MKMQIKRKLIYQMCQGKKKRKFKMINKNKISRINNKKEDKILIYLMRKPSIQKNNNNNLLKKKLKKIILKKDLFIRKNQTIQLLK